MYVILNRGRFVAKSGSQTSYTTSLKHAQKYESETAARNSKCSDETVAPVEQFID